MKFLKLALFVFILLVLEAVYFNGGGSLVMIFIPHVLLLGVGFVGFLFGRRTGLFWGSAAGFLEELCFVGPDAVFGLTPLIYCWIGFFAGVFFYGRADIENPVSGVVIAGVSLIAGLILAAMFGFFFHAKCFLVAGPATVARFFSFFVQVFLVGPLLLKFMRWYFKAHLVQ